MSTSRIKRLLKGELPIEYILYKLCNNSNFFNRSFFVSIYRLIFSKEKNVISNEIRKINVKTYDGFNQSTHPDVIKYGNYTYLISTPYAYCDELLENPSLYRIDKEFNVAPFGKQPLVELNNEKYRHHYSDPAFLIKDNKLTIFYRECVYLNGGRDDIIYQIDSNDAISWESPSIIKHRNYSCISPSFINIGLKSYVYYVEEKDNRTVLVRGMLNDKSITNELEINVDNKLTNMCIWHVDVKKYDDYFLGLFTYIDEPGGNNTRLFKAKSIDGINFEVINEITFGVNTTVKNLYKATSFLTEDNKICAIISARDNKMKWYLYRVFV